MRERKRKRKIGQERKDNYTLLRWIMSITLLLFDYLIVIIAKWMRSKLRACLHACACERENYAHVRERAKGANEKDRYRRTRFAYNCVQLFEDGIEMFN